MSNEYIDLKGILALELPNLTRRLPTLRKMAQELGWPYRKRQGRGGGMEYQVAGLPEEIQTAVRERQAEQLLAQSQPAVLPSVAKAKRPVAVRRMAAAAGYTITINEPQPFHTGVNRAGDRLASEDIMWVWWVDVAAQSQTVWRFRAGSGTAGSRLSQYSDAVIESLFNRLKPAHTAIRFTYR